MHPLLLVSWGDTPLLTPPCPARRRVPRASVPFLLLTAPCSSPARRVAPLLATAGSFSPTRAVPPPPDTPPGRPTWAAAAGAPLGRLPPRHRNHGRATCERRMRGTKQNVLEVTPEERNCKWDSESASLRHGTTGPHHQGEESVGRSPRLPCRCTGRSPHRPPLHQLPDGGAVRGRLVWHYVLHVVLWEMQYPCVCRVLPSLPYPARRLPRVPLRRFFPRRLAPRVSFAAALVRPPLAPCLCRCGPASHRCCCPNASLTLSAPAPHSRPLSAPCGPSAGTYPRSGPRSPPKSRALLTAAWLGAIHFPFVIHMAPV